ncbi:uncharacterized protein [Venturia canescens]|uniref:uncharacterized protein n=1 Tax=Venturia canescens TaxID=32260 RepID=UPI001C9D2BC0|nr:uncharacterized protein LOC122411838 [Venturia canescens]
MLFLWSREPVPSPRAGPWLAWFATAFVLWRCRRRIAKAILAVSPLRLLKRRCIAPVHPHGVYVRRSSNRIHQTSTRSATTTTTNTQREHNIIEKDPKLSLILSPKHTTGIKTRVKRLCTGDGPHVSGCVQTAQQVNYRVTRSGRVYGKYPNKSATQSIS